MNEIAVLLRTLNEERNVGQFIEAYQSWVDYILIADGGSTDNTISIIRNFSEVYDNVFLRHFDERVVGQKDVWRNPEGKHTNFLLDWAMGWKVDWVIFDDCDCRPNYLLKQQGRELIETTEEDFILITRLYLWKDTDYHFVNMAQPGKAGIWEPSLWAWRLSSGLRLEDDVDWDVNFTFRVDKRPRNIVMPPICLLHHPWPDEESIQRKSHLYNNSYWAKGEPRSFNYPNGIKELLPEWAREEE